MLYYKFRKTIMQILNGLRELNQVSEPDVDEVVSSNIKDSFTALGEAIETYRDIVAYLPEELEGYPDKRFGPNVNIYDIQFAMSSLLPVVKQLNSRCPFVSYFPLDLYRESTLLITEYMRHMLCQKMLRI